MFFFLVETLQISLILQGYSVRREVYHRESRSVYFTLAFAGIALMAAAVVGVAVFKRRSARSPHSQVYIERHVSIIAAISA